MRMTVPRPTAETVKSLLLGASCSGIGIFGARMFSADTGDLLAFAGGLIGAGASVWAAFAVAGHAEARKEDGARKLLREIARGVRDDMQFLTRLQAFAVGDDEPVTLARRVDSIAAGVPQTAEFLRVERLGGISGNIATLAAERRLVAALNVAEPHFRGLDERRRQWRRQMEEQADTTVELAPAVITELQHACEQALRDL